MTEHEKIEAVVTHLWEQGKADTEHAKWFMARLAEVGRQAQAERQQQRRKWRLKEQRRSEYPLR